jgi:putative flippase GtrA
VALSGEPYRARRWTTGQRAGGPARPLAARLLPWMVVAVLGFGVQTAVLLVLVHGARLHYLVAMALAVASAVVHNFLWHERWTWADRPSSGVPQRLARLARFVALTGIVSILGGVALTAVFVGRLDLPLAVANLAVVVTLGFVNLLGADRLAFTAERARDDGRTSRPAATTEDANLRNHPGTHSVCRAR